MEKSTDTELLLLFVKLASLHSDLLPYVISVSSKRNKSSLAFAICNTNFITLNLREEFALD